MHKFLYSLFFAFCVTLAFAEPVSSVVDSAAEVSSAADASVATDPSVASPSRDSSTLFHVDSIVYDIGDAFDDSKVHTKYDALAYEFLNWVHIETREMTVRKLLLFNQGGLASLDLMLESERFLREQKFLSDASIKVEQEGFSCVLYGWCVFFLYGDVLFDYRTVVLRCRHSQRCRSECA